MTRDYTFMAMGKGDLLRTPEIMSQPDPRWEYFVNPNGLRINPEQILIGLYESIGQIELSSSVPEGVRVKIEVVRNLFLYSWSVWRFSTVARFHAYTALESALKEKKKIEGTGGKTNSLKARLKKAFEEGWLIEKHAGQAEMVCTGFSQLRNELAHGSSTLAGPNLDISQIKICADLINELFENK